MNDRKSCNINSILIKIYTGLLQPLWIFFILMVIFSLLYLFTKEASYLLLLQCIAIGVIAITIHELGHFIIGKIVGLHLHFMSAGFLLLIPKKNEHKTTIKWNRQLPLSFGMTSMYFANHRLSEREMRRKLIPYLLGGILFNSVTVICCLLLKTSFAMSYFAIDFLNYMLIINMAIIVATSIPLKHTDGYTCFSLC